MAVPYPAVDGEIVVADETNANYDYLEGLIADKPSSPISNTNLQNKHYEIVMRMELLAADLTAAVGVRKYFGAIPYDSVDANQVYRLISYSIVSDNAALRTTAAIFSIQSGGSGGYTNLATGVTIPIANNEGDVSSAVTVGQNFSLGNSGITSALRLVVTQQGVGYAGTDVAVVTLKLARVNGLRSTS